MGIRAWGNEAGWGLSRGVNLAKGLCYLSRNRQDAAGKDAPTSWGKPSAGFTFWGTLPRF